jgi:hypothetical protein
MNVTAVEFGVNNSKTPCSSLTVAAANGPTVTMNWCFLNSLLIVFLLDKNIFVVPVSTVIISVVKCAFLDRLEPKLSGLKFIHDLHN